MGWIGEPAIGHLIESFIESFNPPEVLLKSGSSIIAFILITYLNVVLGELAPKNYAIQQSENAALFIALPLILFHHFFSTLFLFFIGFSTFYFYLIMFNYV